MNMIPEHLRRVACIGLVWAVVWAAIAMMVGTVIGFIDPNDIGPGDAPIALAPMIGFVGLIGGIVFAIILAIAERRRTTPELPLIQVAMWGVLVSAMIPFVMGMGIPEVFVTAPVGALSAMGSVALVQFWVERRPHLR